MKPIANAIQETIAEFAGEDGYLRVVITRGIGPLGIDPKRCSSPTVFIIADQLSMVPEKTRQQGAGLRLQGFFRK